MDGTEDKDVKGFLREYEELCKRYKLAVGYDSRRGIYGVTGYSERNAGYVEGLFELSDVRECVFCGKKHPTTEMEMKTIMVNCTEDFAPMMSYEARQRWFCKGTDCADRYQKIVSVPYWER